MAKVDVDIDVVVDVDIELADSIQWVSLFVVLLVKRNATTWGL